MPQALDVDWSGIRAAAVAMGNISEAARQAAQDLPEEERQRFREAVSKRAVREQWLSKAEQAVSMMSNAPTLQSSKPQIAVSNAVQSGADTIKAAIAENVGKSRIGLSKWARKAGEHLGKLDGEEALAAHQSAVSVATVTSKLDPEQQRDSAAVVVTVNLTGKPDSFECIPLCGTDVEPA